MRRWSHVWQAHTLHADSCRQALEQAGAVANMCEMMVAACTECAVQLDVVGCSKISSILCETHAACVRVRAACGSDMHKHMDASEAGWRCGPFAPCVNSMAPIASGCS